MNITLEEMVYTFPCKYTQGFVDEEINELLAFYNIERKDFNDKHGINTCMLIDNEIINYHCDIYSTINCCLQKRNKNSFEWD